MLSPTVSASFNLNNDPSLNPQPSKQQKLWAPRKFGSLGNRNSTSKLTSHISIIYKKKDSMPYASYITTKKLQCMYEAAIDEIQNCKPYSSVLSENWGLMIWVYTEASGFGIMDEVSRTWEDTFWATTEKMPCWVYHNDLWVS